MKRLMSITATTFACLSTTLLPLPGSSMTATAQAAEVCEFTANPAVTGGAIQQQIDAIARCNSSKPTIQTPQTVNLQSPQRNQRSNSITPAKESCNSAFSGAVTGGVIHQQLENLAHCQDKAPQAMTNPTQSLQLESFGQGHNTRPDTPAPNDLNQAACPSLPQATTVDDLQYRVAFERCKYGA